ncbi:FERM protein [Cooperia oncophora]
MPSLFRSLSQRFRRSPPNQCEIKRQDSTPKIDNRRQSSCKVLLLDGTDLNVVVPKNALASEVYDQVFYSLDLEERDYFGLQFTDHYHVHHWLDPMKKIVKQVPIGPPYTFRFRVKFYTNEPTELGDYNPNEHNALFISQFRFHPEQDAQMELDILERYKLCRGQTPSQSEANYLSRAKWIERYGVDMHTVEGKDGNQYTLGLTPSGMLVYDGNEKIGLFFWEKIQKLDFKNRKITLVVEEDADQSATGQVQLHTFVFNLASHKACKHLWKCAIEHHTFFRLKTRSCVKHSRSQLFRLGSTFKYRGRTEYEAVHKDGARLSRRTTATFERRPSQRYGPRQSHAFNKAPIKPEATNPTTTGVPVSSVPTEQLISTLSIGETIEKPPVPSIPPLTNAVTTIPVTTVPMTREIAPPITSFTSAPSRDNSSFNVVSSPPKQPSPPTVVPSVPSSSQHITMIPISATKEKSPSPPQEKVTMQFSEPAEIHPSSRSTSRIPKYVSNSVCRDHGDEPDTKLLTTSETSTTSKSPVQTDLETDLENVSPSLLTSSSPTNMKTKPNTGIPKPSKIRPPTATTKLRSTETNGAQEDSRISKIPKISDGLRTTTNGQCAFSGTTHIPIRTGFDRTSQSRLITDL